MTLVSNNVKPGGNFVVLDLEPATRYHLQVTAHNNAGFAVAEYEFATLTLTGGMQFFISTFYYSYLHGWIILNDSGYRNVVIVVISLLGG